MWVEGVCCDTITYISKMGKKFNNGSFAYVDNKDYL